MFEGMEKLLYPKQWQQKQWVDGKGVFSSYVWQLWSVRGICQMSNDLIACTEKANQNVCFKRSYTPTSLLPPYSN